MRVSELDLDFFFLDLTGVADELNLDGMGKENKK